MAEVFAVTHSRNSFKTVLISVIMSLIAMSSSFRTDDWPGVGWSRYVGAGNSRLGVSLGPTKLSPAHALCGMVGVAWLRASRGRVISVPCAPPWASPSDVAASNDDDDDVVGGSDLLARIVSRNWMHSPILASSSADVDALLVLLVLFMIILCCICFTLFLFSNY